MIRTPVQLGMPVIPPSPEVPFPFGPDFQIRLLKVLMLDDAGELVLTQIQPQYFESPEMRWLFSEIQTYWKALHTIPTWMVIKQRAMGSDSKYRPTIQAMIDYLQDLPVPEEQWIREQILEWVQQNLFWLKHKECTALWNAGKRKDAIDHSRKQDEIIQEAVWTKIDRGWFFEELPGRENRRAWDHVQVDSIPTGISDLDKLLNGGLSRGELGIWIAYAKGGKSSMLMNHGAMAVRAGHKKVLHFILEGSRKQLEDRYETWFSNELYTATKFGTMSQASYAELYQEYQYLRNLLVIRGFTDAWSYTALNVEAEIKDLRKHHGWIPDMIIVDYGDLLKGRDGPYSADWMSQRDSFRDLKIIANRGYTVWTASQANYPDTKEFDTKPHEIKVNQIAGGKEKVRVADFVGSLNQTLEERAAGQARIFAELYRDNEAGKVIGISTDLTRMKMGSPGLAPPPNESIGPGPVAPSLGYKEVIAEAKKSGSKKGKK